MRYFVGTSGYAYKEWKGSFYPEKLPAKQMLAHYATRLSAVEVNYTFRQLPSRQVVESWAEQVPQSFRFVLKAPQAITHFKRLRNVRKVTTDFLRVASHLGKRRGPVLFQLPPNFKKDVKRLGSFLEHLDGASAAFEFRHESWHDDEVFDCLRSHRVALCVADAEELPKVALIPTANWGFLRLRRVNYSDDQLRQWVKRTQAQPWKECYVFFKHEDQATGPPLAARFLELAKA